MLLIMKLLCFIVRSLLFVALNLVIAAALAAPRDSAALQEAAPRVQSAADDTAQSIAIVSESNVDLSLVQAYQSLFGLSANLPSVVVDGSDPGQNSAATEAYLDLEIAGSVAPGATVMLYTSGGTALTSGLALAAMRAVEEARAAPRSTRRAQPRATPSLAGRRERACPPTTCPIYPCLPPMGTTTASVPSALTPATAPAQT